MLCNAKPLRRAMVDFPTGELGVVRSNTFELIAINTIEGSKDRQPSQRPCVVCKSSVGIVDILLARWSADGTTISLGTRLGRF